MSDKILICAAWPYVNGDVHIGHLAGYFIPGDITARYFRLMGMDVLFVSGTDCHGTPITVEADKKGVTPLDIVNEYDPKARELIKLYNFSYDNFTTTTTENHKKVTQHVFLKLLENGFIIKQKSLQYYSQEDSKFLPDRYVEGECPYCHSKEQRSDQCENCGRSLGMGELIEPYSKLTKSPVVQKETEHYFIDYPKLQSEIKAFVEPKKDLWKNWVWQETMGWINEGLQPRAITRDLDWGVEIPVDQIPENLRLENAESKRFYVWFDAVIGYLSAAIEYCDLNGKNYEEFWKNEDAKHYYFMGQDNLTFHTIFWPGQLIGTREGYTLPHMAAVVKFLNANGAKLSKSRGNIIDAKQVVEKYGADLIRFYIISILPENKESNWDWDDFQNTINSELVGNIGNFIHRTLTFYKNKLDGTLEKQELDENVKQQCEDSFKKIGELIEQSHLVAAVEEIKNLSRFGNQYFDHNKPWANLVDNKAEAEKTIYNCLNIVVSLAKLLAPFIPDSIVKLENTLGYKISDFKFSQLDTKNLHLAEDILPLFAKIDTTEDKSSNNLSRAKSLLEPVKLVKVVNLEKHPDADNLNVVKVSDGKKESIVITAAKNLNINDIVAHLSSGGTIPGPAIKKGKKIVLGKKDFKGIESDGMLLAEDELGLSDLHFDVKVFEGNESLVGKSVLEIIKVEDVVRSH